MLKKLTDFGVLAICALSLVSARAEEKSLTSEELLTIVNKLDAMTLVTPDRLKMATHVRLLCRPPTPKDYDHSELMPDKPDAHYKVFVTKDGAAAMNDPKGVFPVGAVIYKQKFVKKDATETELFTGMLKREKGFNPDCGDWEFFIVDGAGKKISERGKTQSCMDCHKLYPESDFVTKKYIKAK